MEKLTDEIEARAEEIIRKIDELGGMVAAIERGYPQMEIARSAYEYQKAIEAGERIIVGVNAFRADEEPPIPILEMRPEVEVRQKERIKDFRARREKTRWQEAIDQVKTAAAGNSNLMEAVLEAVRGNATLGEICDCFREVLGVYREDVAVC